MADSSSLIGHSVSHHRVIERLGGGMSAVYEAEDLKLHCSVPLKFLPEELERNPAARERFQREAFAASALNHPDICTIYQIDEANGQHLMNIFVTRRGRPKVLDFGPAKLTAQPKSAAPAAAKGFTANTEGPETQLTSPGSALGTAAYMSPEQARGKKLDARTDLFSFGVVLYEMATASLPFRGDASAVIFEADLLRRIGFPQ
jgi:serine/threonine protein kinase